MQWPDSVQSCTNKRCSVYTVLFGNSVTFSGMSHDDIARVLSISAKTVGNSHYLIKNKLGVASDIELTKLAIKLNVLDLLELSRIVA
jgi:hypothetical protein